MNSSEHSAFPLLTQFFRTLNRPVVIIDLETTGGHLDNDRITEIAFLRFHNDTISRHQWLVNPQMPIQPFVQKLTGISDSMVADAPIFSEIINDLLPLLRGSILLAHNSKFDYGFLCRAFSRHHVPFASFSLCTVQLSRKLYPQYHRHNLDSIIERFAIPIESRHRAMSDVWVLAQFLEQTLQQNGETALRQFCQTLIHPKLPQQPLPKNLQAALSAISDENGIGVWYNAHQQPLHISHYHQSFHEALQEYERLRNGKLSAAVDFTFLPAVGPLHALAQKARLPDASEPTGWYTVRFEPNAHNELQAHIVEIHSGIQAAPGFGLFRHKKSAKRALLAWATQYKLCPATLDILPVTYPRNQPCPIQAAGLCSGECRGNDAAQHNERIKQYAPMLPIDGWSNAHAVKIIETHSNGQTVEFNCAHGFLQLPDNLQYFDNTLPEILKGKFKQGKNTVEVLY